MQIFQMKKQKRVDISICLQAWIYLLKYDCGTESTLKNICGIDVGLIEKSMPNIVKCSGMAIIGGLIYLLADNLSKEW